MTRSIKLGCWAKPFEDLSHKGFCERIHEHELCAAFDHLHDIWLCMGQKMMELDGDIFLSIAQMLRICHKKCTSIVLMNMTMNG